MTERHLLIAMGLILILGLISVTYISLSNFSGDGGCPALEYMKTDE